MPDILKVTTPIINKNQPVAPKNGPDPLMPFSLQDASKVIQTHNQSELLKQNTGMLEGKDSPALLMSLLKDPAVAVSYLKNIFLLEEIFSLLPAKNTTVTPEIEQLFHTLLLPGEEIAPELQRQEGLSTLFKGELFDFLREVSAESPDNNLLQEGIAMHLKAVNNLMSKGDVLDAVANGLTFLKENLVPGSDLSTKLNALAQAFRMEDAPQRFTALKNETLAVLKEIESSFMFSPKLAKNLSMTTYNLSRFNDSEDFFRESAFRLRQLLPPAQKPVFMKLAEEFLRSYRKGAAETAHAAEGQEAGRESRVMDSLIKLVQKQAEQGGRNPADAATTEKILHSLLSSPCNFTPLQHFIVPALQDNVRAFAEIWINPQSDEKDMPEGAGRGIHLLAVIDAEGVGRFEAEFFVHGSTLDFSLFCPPGTEERYRAVVQSLPRILTQTAYHTGKMRLEPLQRARSLMDVFKSLPYKRVGVDVTV